MNRLTQDLAAWIACFAILMALFAPTISHALAENARGASETEICSTAGIKFIHVDNLQTSDSSVPAEHDQHKSHCQFCRAHDGSAGLPPPSSVLDIPVVDASFSHPALFYQSPSSLFIWAAAQSRAPPFPS